MRNLSDLYDLHNFQDVAILCEIMENCFEFIPQIYGFKPRMCNSANAISGCIGRSKSKIIFVLLTNTELIWLSDDLLSEGLSCINTRVGFDTEILMPNLSAADYKK